jgi:Ca2+-binding EF-hand superfamily protein
MYKARSSGTNTIVFGIWCRKETPGRHGSSNRALLEAPDLPFRPVKIEERTLQYFRTSFVKHTIAAFIFAVLAAGCATQSANPSENLAARVDQSKDGRISKEEFVDWNIARIFKLYDAGGKGYVTLEDWQRLQGTSKDAQYKRLDAKHDGKVTLEEARANPRVRAVMGGTFADADTNHDGFIDRKEAAAYLVKRQTFVP